MKSMKLLLGISLLVLIIGIGSLGVMAASTWKIATSVIDDPENSYQAACLKFKEIAERELNASIKFQIFPQAQLGSDREILEGIQSGLIEMGVSAVGPASAFNAEIASILELPFLFKNLEHLDAVIDGPIGEKILEVFEKAGLKALAFTDDGISNFTCSKRQIHSVEDFKGLQIRTMESPTQVATIKALGANPVPIDYGELYSALQTGVVDGQQNAHWVTVSKSLWEVQKYLSCTQHFWSGAILFVNLKNFNALSLEDQRIMIEASKKACKYSRKVSREKDASYLQTSIDHGMIVDLHPDTESMRKAVSQVYKDIYDKHPDWKLMIEEIIKLATDF